MLLFGNMMLISSIKLVAVQSRVSQLLTIKSERVIHSSRYLPVRTAEICPSALTCRPLKKREVLESTVKGLRSRRFPSKKFHDPASAQHDVAPNPTDHATESVPAATDNTAPASGLHVITHFQCACVYNVIPC